MTEVVFNPMGWIRSTAKVVGCSLSLVLISVPIAAIAQQTPFVQRSTLQQGTRGQEVTELQAVLKLMGYYTGPVDGIYSEGTVRGVSAFQQAAGLTPDGIVGEGTWNRLFPPSPGAVASGVMNPASVPFIQSSRPILRQGMESDWVAQLQQRLNQMGFFEGSPTGVFGPRTDASVRALQSRYNLEPDGIVGPSTWSILFP
ncbi:peptidoglycan-binding domain-containing protein [Laspinema olomoucense]|uniref:peptidoglycan-binding domain-containing protein n=1 Tax=Laspinema olomoucense TaxID=3231600 RepID=UPI0021BAE636|nr:peptidoglycan-binding protein [Laspinema sp. D3c]MCT7993771.1 peptidoglycan-binding protein [Laspinema sp. D3c]